MASAASPSRKRKSSSSDLDNGSSSRKKSKDSERDASKDSSHSKRTKPKSKKDIKAGLKTVSELAKLVTSGAVQVPKSLMHYVSDKPVLLDQIFTILSPSDVNEMLPDILKGLKIKRIKSLCYEQLKQMSVEEITRALRCEETTPVDVSTTTEMTSSEANPLTPAPPMATVNKPKDAIEKAGGEKVGQTAQVLSGECRKKDSNAPNPDSCPEGRELLNSPRDTSRKSKDEIVLHVSDISDEEDGKIHSRRTEKPKEGERERDGKTRRKCGDPSINNEPGVLKKEYIIPSLRVATQKRQNSDKESSKTKTPIESQDLKMEKEATDIASNDDVINEDDVMSEMDTREGLAVKEAGGSESSDEGSDDLTVEVSELDAAKLLEMEMRRRALESELKKFSQNSDQTTKLRSETSLANDCSASDNDDGECSFLALHVSESETLDSQCESGSRNSEIRKTVVSLEEFESRGSAGVSEVKMETDTLDVGQLLEMKLRQKALQSLLNKKKQNSSTQ